MKYLITEFDTCNEILSSFCQRTAEALIEKNDKTTKIYIELDKVLSIPRFKSFCEVTLPFIRNKKPQLKFYKAKVLFPIADYVANLFDSKVIDWSIKDQLSFESSVQINKFCYLAKQKGKGVN